jgi:mono/diheme cytochrome c family protein
MIRDLMLLVASAAIATLPASGSTAILRAQHSSPGDLEVGGMLAGQPPGATRYIRYEDLLRLPLQTFHVSDDVNFKGPVDLQGILLEDLGRLLGEDPGDAMIVAICYDKYRTNYPHDYVAAHHPFLVLRVNGQLRDHWPHSEYGESMGPYLISHPYFKASFKILSHEDEPQIPFGVTRIDVQSESATFGAIRPRGNWSRDSKIGKGYIIARQDCFRCHNMGAYGGTLADRSWLKLASLAGSDEQRFRQTIRSPLSVRPGAKMPAHGAYDDATLDALSSYFKTFVKAGRHE